MIVFRQLTDMENVATTGTWLSLRGDQSEQNIQGKRHQKSLLLFSMLEDRGRKYEELEALVSVLRCRL